MKAWRALIAYLCMGMVFALVLVCPPAVEAETGQTGPAGSVPEETSAMGTGDLTPAQVKAAKEALAGGEPGALEAIKAAKGFEGLSGEEILEGRQKLQKAEAEARPPEEKSAPAAIEEAPGSLFDRFRTAAAYQDINTRLKPFGYDFFATAALELMTPRKDIPVPSEYIIGPGDEVVLLLWGRVNARHDLMVDRDGNITVPQLGPLHVAGMRFDQMKGYLAREAEQIVGANLSVTMGDLKSIRVFVLGDVRRPGSYALNSFSTVTTALIAAGGPTQIGSLRTVQLKRDGATAAVLDLYDLLLKGDKSDDRVLQSGDIVFVPTVGPLAAVAGNVKRPAIYELRDKRDLKSLFDLAGGIIPTAYTQQIQVERIVKNQRQIVIDIDDKDLSRSGDFVLQDADLVKVFPIVDKDLNAVYLYGNVKRPGKYELRPGMTLKDLIGGASGLLKDTSLDYGLIKRLRLPDLSTELVPFNPGKLLLEGDAKSDIELRPRDRVYLFSKWLFEDRPHVKVEGLVRHAGTFEIAENMRVRDAVLSAGGLAPDAYLGEAELYREDAETGNVSLEKFILKKALEGEPANNIRLKDRDRIVVHSLLEQKYRRSVSVEGDVLNPGSYEYTDGMTVNDLIFAAGNVLESAYLEEAEISSQILEDGKDIKISHRTVNLRKALQGGAGDNLALRPYDTLTVKRLADWRSERFVEISGEVRHPGKYLIKKGERLSSLIERAGGFTGDAYLRGSVFTRESVRETQQRQLDEMLQRLERDLMSKGAADTAGSLTPDDAKINEFEVKQKKEFLEKLRQYKAKGRMYVHLADPDALKDTMYDIELKRGDRLYVPSNPNSVQVIGSVYNQMAFVYDEDAVISNYIELSGGYSENADKDSVYVLKADGTAVRKDGGALSGLSWNRDSNRWEQGRQKVQPGDTIVVPEKLERTAWLRQTKDITQILYQIAVTAGVVIVAF